MPSLSHIGRMSRSKSRTSADHWPLCEFALALVKLSAEKTRDLLIDRKWGETFLTGVFVGFGDDPGGCVADAEVEHFACCHEMM